MKLRIEDNTIRLRLTKTEVSAFFDFGSISDVIEIPGGPMSYGLEKCGEPDLNVHRLGDSIRIGLPIKLAKNWQDDDCVGFTHVQVMGERTIIITVEKDFKCTTPVDCGNENNEDLFDNPNAK